MSAHLTENPFFVLELTREAGAMDVERAGQKLLGMLKVGMSSAKTYKTPLGERARDEDAVRRAMADLRDPEKREAAAFWASPDVWKAAALPSSKTDTPTWPEAHQKLRTLDSVKP
jgi:hypothetical protein